MLTLTRTVRMRPGEGIPMVLCTPVGSLSGMGRLGVAWPWAVVGA